MSPLRLSARQAPPQAAAKQGPAYWFALGREPMLSAAELAAVLNLSEKGFELNGEILRTNNNIGEAALLIKRLGGTIKIGQEIGRELSAAELVKAIIEDLLTIDGKIQFGISLNEQNLESRIKNLELLERLGKTIKQNLVASGRSVRFVFNNEIALSSVSVEKNGLTKRGREFVILPSPQRRGAGGEVRFDLAKTLSVQPFEEWAKRDFGRPGRDDLSGMLPPKLALMLANLASPSPLSKGGQWGVAVPDASFSLLDPFCGSGTILTEAALLGFKNLVGSDISKKAVADSHKNLEWTSRQFLNFPISNLNIFESDIRDLSKHIQPGSVDAVVTEPYLGPPLNGHESTEQIKRNCNELSRLYQTAFEQFKKVLKPGGTVVFIIPRYTIHGIRYTISDKIMPHLNSLGFEKQRLLPEELSKPYYLVYHRPGQFVGREIWKFALHQNGTRFKLN